MDSQERDEALVGAARGGDTDAFAVLLARHRPLLIAVCRRALRDEGLAEDAAQEAALQAFLNLDQLRRPDRFGPWLAGIGLNMCRRWLRQRSRDAWSWEAVIGGRFIAEEIDPAPVPEELSEVAELREWVNRVVEGLPEGQRAAVVLHYLAGLTQRETAALLGIEVGAVKTRLHKARTNLRRGLWNAPVDRAKREGAEMVVEMRLIDVRRRLMEEGEAARHIAVLEETNGERRLTIWMGEFEATALALHLERTALPRPATYAFAAGILQAANGRLREVRIDRLEGEVFYATAVIDGPAGDREVDARPSDALNLALQFGVPIRVHGDVLATAGGVRTGEEWKQLAEQSAGPAVIVAEVMAGWASTSSAKTDEESE